MTNRTGPETHAPELRLLDGLRSQHATPDGDAADRMRHAVLHGTSYRTSTPTSTRTSDGPAAGRARGRRRITVSVLAAALAVAGAAGTTAALAQHTGTKAKAAPNPTGGQHIQAPVIGDHDNAQLVLAVAAQTTQAEPTGTIRPGQLVYRKSTEVAVDTLEVAGGELHIFSEQRHEAWLDPQHGLNAVRIRMTTGLNRRPVTPQDAALAASSGYDLNAPPQTSDTDHPTNPKAGIPPAPPARAASLTSPTPQYLASLPTDPTRLLALLRQAAKAEGNTKWSTDKIAFGIVSDLFEWGDPMLSPALRAGLYRAIALMPAVQRIDGQADLSGRRGIAIGFTERGERHDIILDPVTLHPIGSRDVQLTAAYGIPAGTVEALNTFAFAVVNKSDQTG
jgi:hypothetical protein